ncbi:MAG: DUF3597 domain-containing protein [Rhodopila sp.]
MSVFGSIMSKIFGSSEAAGTATGTGSSGAQDAAGSATSPGQPGSGASVDVGAVLTQLASQKGGGGNWQSSIVDLLKLLDLDSSLDARKELGNELSVHAGADGTAEQNIALHRAVMQKLAENGGKIPDNLRH